MTREYRFSLGQRVRVVKADGYDEFRGVTGTVTKRWEAPLEGTPAYAVVYDSPVCWRLGSSPKWDGWEDGGRLTSRGHDYDEDDLEPA